MTEDAKMENDYLCQLFGVSEKWVRGFYDGYEDATALNIRDLEYLDGYDMGRKTRNQVES